VKAKRVHWLLWLGWFAALPAGAGGQSDRVLRLENTVLAPCCYTEPVSIHQSEIAMKMRLEIAKWVEQGKSDDEILAEYKGRYGAKVMVDPRSIPQEWSYVVPWMMTIAAGTALSVMVWRWRRRAPAPAMVSTQNLPDLPPDED
jgi:cytochrome c-type biogenesis protein CcmH/NrfF